MSEIRKRLLRLSQAKSYEMQMIIEDGICRDWDLLQARANKAEVMVERLIEAGNRVSDNLDFVDGTTCRESLDEWDALVTEWRKGEQA